ncbi:hypothetical protein Sango_1751200 [Sesamum angolense]|uniref:Reverse transcriptase domain-containing protein n=1 Tax=Sesamum angolense TaxID=2727404 RepID=A0AAE1WML4_9LAMI|nr:hypothetical protein Sango_1751200 [Sesamum angolense]
MDGRLATIHSTRDRGREHIFRDCLSQTPSWTQSQSNIGSSSRGAEKDKGRDTGNRDGDHTIGGSMRGLEHKSHSIRRERHVAPVCVISAMEIRRLILEGCEAYLAYVIDIENVNPTLEEIPIVRDFPKVFPDDLLGFPPHRKVDFTIKTVPGVA